MSCDVQNVIFSRQFNLIFKENKSVKETVLMIVCFLMNDIYEMLTANHEKIFKLSQLTFLLLNI